MFNPLNLFGGKSGRYVCVQQRDQSDCGVAALASMAKYHGGSVNVTKLRELTGTVRRGTTMLGLKKGAEKLGFEAQGAKAFEPPVREAKRKDEELSAEEYRESVEETRRMAEENYDGLKDVDTPFIAHVITEEGYPHFVVVYEVQDDYLYVADPAEGTVETWDRDTFTSRWQGYLLLLFLDELTDFASATSKMDRLIALVKPWTDILFQSILAAFAFILLGFGSSFFTQFLIDNVIRHEARNLLTILVIGMGIVLLFRLIFGLIRGYLLIRLSEKLNLSLVSYFFRHIIRVPLKFFHERTVGEVLQRVSDSFKIRSAITSVTLSVLLDSVIVLAAFALMFAYNVELALLVTLVLPLIILSGLAFLLPLQKYQRRAMEHGEVLNSKLVESVNGIETLKSFNNEEEHVFECDEAFIDTLKSGIRAQFIGMGYSVTNTLISGTATVVLLWFGALKVMNGEITLGQLMFFSTLIGFVMGPIKNLARIATDLQDAWIAMDRVFEYLDLKTEFEETEDRVRFERLRDGITFEEVSFNYGHREDVLSNVNLEVPSGKNVALVGETGTGKTTLCRLMAGLYYPTEGEVLLDGIKIQQYDPASVRSQFGVVHQEPTIFNKTLRENIVYGNRNVPMEEVIDAAKAAGLHQFVRTLPQGYNTNIGERGANLSGGQRQRLAIARALIEDPEIFVFDEATSHLDSATERAIHKALRERLEDRTVVLVAHRLSTLLLSDYVYVLKDRTVVQEGTHEELIRQDGVYRRLMESQYVGLETESASLQFREDSS